MKYSKAILLARKSKKKSTDFYMISSLETNVLETYLKAYAYQQGEEIGVRGSDYGDIGLSIRSSIESSFNEDKVVVLVQGEDLMKCVGYRIASPYNIDIDQLNSSMLSLLEGLSAFVLKFSTKQIILVTEYSLEPELGVAEYELGILEYIAAKWRISLYEMAAKNTNLCVIDLKKAFKGLADSDVIDLSAYMKGGWLYSHQASSLLAEAIYVKTKKQDRIKIIISDCDNTLWKGILAETSASEVSWLPEGLSYKHCNYQKILNFLSEKGLLISLCTRNEDSQVHEVLDRKDLVLKRDNILLVKCTWKEKSVKIRQILNELNLLEENALFIDDSSYELNEVKHAISGINILKFPTEDKEYRCFLSALSQLLGSFSEGMNADIRLSSYKQMAEFNKSYTSNIDKKGYLKSLNMVVDFVNVGQSKDSRVVELLNKTNQFNLNGEKLEVFEIDNILKEGFRIFKVGLTDTLGEYGTVSILIYKIEEKKLYIRNWVLSCRVFGRNIELGILVSILEVLRQYKIEEIVFNYVETQRNTSIRSFLKNSLDIALSDNQIAITVDRLMNNPEQFIGNYSVK